MNLVNELLHKKSKTAVIDGSDAISHDDLRNSSLRIAAGLISDEGITPGDRVAIIAHNSIEFLVAYLAVVASGAVAIPLDPYAHESERARDIALISPSLVITSSADLLPGTYADDVRVLEFHSSQWRAYRKKKPVTPVERESSDVAVMMMTSGASFQPRPAMLTHGSLSANLAQARLISDLDITNKDVLLAALPMYHIFGLHVVCGLALSSGARLVVTRTLDPVELAHVIEHEKVTIIPGVPAMFDAFVRTSGVTIDSLTSVRLFFSGGAPMRADVREQFYHRFGSHIAEGYGLTEASPMVSFCAQPQCEGDLGTPLRGVEIELRDSEGSPVLDDDIGEVVIHGDNVFAGYFREKEATSQVLDHNGWLYTGDVGVRRDDGHITLIDRSVDVIVVNGFSVFPSEVEAVLVENDCVEHVSVVGALDEKSGECVVAYIHPISSIDTSDPKVTRRIEQELRENCFARLARYKVPSRFEFIDRPVVASGRPLRKALRTALRNLD